MPMGRRKKVAGAPDGLAARLRDETQPEHQLAEATRFAKAFFRGRLDIRAYGLGLARFEPVYSALEHGLRAHVELAEFVRPEVFRQGAILADLERFGNGQRSIATPYSARIRELARENPFALLGHFYVRYFADLSGVARVAPFAHRLLGIPKSEPMEFFRFPAISDRKAIKNELRLLLDAVPRAHHETILDEARRSFRLHRELVDELLDVLERPHPTRTTQLA